MSAERIYGWWSFDAAGMVLNEDGRDARLRYLGRADDDAELGLRRSNVGHWLRFDAELNGLTYPLLVEVRFRRPPLSGRGPVWRLDHIRSAALAARTGAVSPYPSYEQWITLDHFAVDALLCWPETEPTGWKVQSGVAVNGGWRTGAWRPDLFRYYSGVSTSNEPHEPWTPIARPRPQQQPHWTFVGAARRPAGDELIQQVETLASAEPARLPSLVDSIAKTRPHLRSGDALLVPFAGSDRYPGFCWLYADLEVVTDCFRVSPVAALPPVGPFRGSAPSWRVTHSSFRSLIGTIGRRTGGRVPISADLRQRLFELTEGILCAWEDCTVDLPDLSGEHASYTLSAPTTCWVQHALIYGGRSQAAAVVSLSLDRAMDLQPLFDDASPSVIGSQHPMKGMVYDHDNRSMRNSRTGQSLTFDRVLDGTPNFASDQESLFRYVDSDIEMPVVVRRRGVLPLRGDRKIEPYWRIDHEASRHRAGGSAPALSTWGRVSDHIFDAIMLWPETDYAGPAPEGALSMAGWLDGRWEPSLRRVGSRAFVLDDATVDPVNRFSATEAPARWEIVGEPGQAIREMIAIDLDGSDDYLVDPISIGDLIDGRYGARQFQVREDLSAAFFVCGSRKLQVGPDGAEVALPVYEYCDQDVRVRCAANTQGIALDPLLAPRLVRTGPLAATDDAASLIYVISSDRKRVRPGAELYRRLIDALTGGLIPRTAQQKCTIVGRFQAGVWLGYHPQSFWLDRV